MVTECALITKDDMSDNGEVCKVGRASQRKVLSAAASSRKRSGGGGRAEMAKNHCPGAHGSRRSSPETETHLLQRLFRLVKGAPNAGVKERDAKAAWDES